jgi:hypothetical protein
MHQFIIEKIHPEKIKGKERKANKQRKEAGVRKM